MHELSIAMSLVDLACEEAVRLNAARVEALHVRVGPLSGVVTEALVFSFTLASDDTPIAGARLVIEPVAITALCSTCQVEHVIVSPQHLRCPVCHRPTPHIIHGRELELVALEIDEHSAEADGTAHR
jgi:hydrogenase nickel incorporation protein HypA/HybF